MLEIIKQLALDVAEVGADLCMGRVTAADPLTIRLEEGMELTEPFLIQMEHTQRQEETGEIRINDGSWNRYHIYRERGLRQGETVALLRAAQGQQYLVLGRVKQEE